MIKVLEPGLKSPENEDIGVIPGWKYYRSHPIIQGSFFSVTLLQSRDAQLKVKTSCDCIKREKQCSKKRFWPTIPCLAFSINRYLHFEIMLKHSVTWPALASLLSAYFKCDVYSFSKDHLDYHIRMPVTCYLMYKFTYFQQLLCHSLWLFNAEDIRSPGVSNTEIVFSTKCRYLIISGSSLKTSNTGSGLLSLALTDVRK